MNWRPRARILYYVKLIGVGVRRWTPNGWLGQIIGPLGPQNNPQRGEDSVMTYIYSITPLLHHYNTWQDGCDIVKGPGCALVTLSTWGTRTWAHTTGSDKKVKTYQPCYYSAVHTKTNAPSWLLKNRLLFSGRWLLEHETEILYPTIHVFSIIRPSNFSGYSCFGI